MAELATMIRELGANFNSKTDELSTRINELEKLSARASRASYSSGGSNTVGQRVIGEAALKDFEGGNVRHRAVIQLGSMAEYAAITSGPATVGSNTSGATSLVPSHRVDGIVAEPLRPLTVRGLFAQAPTTSNLIEWAEEETYTNAARPVTEGTTKPYSEMTFELKSAPVRTIAHLFKMSKQIFDDAPQLSAHIDVRGVHGLELKTEDQILHGDGTGQNLDGIMNQAASFDTGLLKSGDTNELDYIRRAILQVRLAEHRATGVVMHPTAAADVDLIKEDTTGKYMIVNPLDGFAGRAWRLPVVESTGLDPDQFLVGAFKTGATVFDRQSATLEISTENDRDFETNMMTARIEERIALAVFAPKAFVVGTFGAST